MHASLVFIVALLDMVIAKECKDRLSAYRCTLFANHGVCTNKRQLAEIYCQKHCGFCGEKCHSMRYGCCNDGKTPAKGPHFYGCKESCVDTGRPYFCQSIVRIGFCGRPDFQKYSDMCLNSCKLCRPCRDVNTRKCKRFARSGKCEKNKAKTYNQCRKSCNVCGKKDPCQGFKCTNANTKCRVDHLGVPYCGCRAHCDPDDHYTGTVCGRDGKEYKNRCRLFHANCDSAYPVTVRNYGRCQRQKRRSGFLGNSLLGNSIDNNSIYPLRRSLGCENSVFGCCIDGRSHAKGPNLKGCHKRKCKDKSKHLCRRFKPDCNSPNTWNKSLMRMRCPKTCYYCS
ncbi:agrin-like [Clytia hemisphaerica]|uniref:Uncharacterized protein n=1 Tax=Clytia hemisphaerica TaxID=252671 RepID=A0A7M5WVM8_9CNID